MKSKLEIAIKALEFYKSNWKFIRTLDGKKIPLYDFNDKKIGYVIIPNNKLSDDEGKIAKNALKIIRSKK